MIYLVFCGLINTEICSLFKSVSTFKFFFLLFGNLFCVVLVLKNKRLLTILCFKISFFHMSNFVVLFHVRYNAKNVNYQFQNRTEKVENIEKYILS